MAAPDLVVHRRLPALPSVPLAMSDWLDPRKWIRQIPDPLGVLGHLGASVDSLFNEMATAVKGRRFRVANASLPISGTIDSFEIRQAEPGAPRPNDRGVKGTSNPGFGIAGRVDLLLSQVSVGPIRCGRVGIRAESLRIVSRPWPRLCTGPVEIRAEVDQASLGPWIERAGIEVLHIDAAQNRARVRHRRGRIHLESVVSPRAAHTAVAFVVEDLWILRRRIRLPAAVDLAVHVGVGLTDGVRLHRVTIRDAHTVAVELRADALEYPLDVRRLRSTMALRNEAAVIDVADPPASGPGEPGPAPATN